MFLSIPKIVPQTVHVQLVSPRPPEFTQPGKEGEPDQHPQQRGETDIGQPGHVRLRPQEQQAPNRIIHQVCGIDHQKERDHLGGSFETKSDEEALILFPDPDLMLDESMCKEQIGQTGDHKKEVLQRVKIIPIESVPQVILKGGPLQPHGQVCRDLSDRWQEVLDILSPQSKSRIQPCFDVVEEHGPNGQSHVYGKKSKLGKPVIPPAQ